MASEVKRAHHGILKVLLRFLEKLPVQYEPDDERFVEGEQGRAR